MKPRKFFTFFFLVLSYTSTISASSGSSAFDFLNIPMGVRSPALAGGGSALVCGHEAVFLNPAGLTSLSAMELGLSYSAWFQDFFHTAAVFASPLMPGLIKPWGKCPRLFTAFSVLVNGSGSIPATVIDNDMNVTAASSSFTASDILTGLSLAGKFSGGWSLGVTVRFLSQRIADVSHGLAAFDAGIRLDGLDRKGFLPFLHGLNASAGVRNMAGNFKLLENETFLPLVVTAGISASPLSDAEKVWSVVLDTTVPAGSWVPEWAVGTEYSFRNLVFLRLGYRFGTDTGNLSLGGGINLSLRKMDIRADYTFVNYGVLGPTHRVGLTLAYSGLRLMTDEVGDRPAEKPAVTDWKPAAKGSGPQDIGKKKSDTETDESDFEIKDEE